MATKSVSTREAVFSAAFLSIMAVAVAVLLCSCSAAETQSASSSASSSAAASISSAADAQTSANQNDVTITVTSPEGPDAIDFSQQISVAEGATVLDALEATELEVTVLDGPYGAYVEAIGGIANEGTSGWTYTVNGEQPQVSAGEMVVNAGDTIAWAYSDAAE